jgi:hypothetical protein
MTTMTQTMTSSITDQELLALERQYWDALKARDFLTIGRLSAEKSTVAGAGGASVLDPRSIAKTIETGSYRLNDYRIDPQSVQVNPICDGASAISYKVHEDIEVDDKNVQLDAYDVSVWKQTSNGWTCILHTESIEGDAFGRDRKLVQMSS